MQTSTDGKPAPTTVLLVRHGATPTTGKVLPGRAPGLSLSETGSTQAKAVAGQLTRLHEREGRPLTAIYASPLERTTETAAAIADATGLTVRPHADLVDLDIGEWTGMELETARKQPEWDAIQRYPSGFRFPGGESFRDMQARMLSSMDELCAAHPGGTVVAVSHADPIRALVSHAMGSHLDLFQRVMVSPCSITAIAFGPAGPAVLVMNANDVGALVGS